MSRSIPGDTRNATRRRKLPARWGRRRAVLLAASLPILVTAAGPVLRASPRSRDPLSVPKRDILITTTINAGGGWSATLVEFFTGDKAEQSVIDMLLGLYRVEGEQRRLVDSRDYNADAGGYVSRGSLQIMDLDRDGTNEVLVEYHHRETPGATRVDLDVLRIGTGRLALAWSGPVRVDTTSPGLGVSPSERERFVREIEFTRTVAQMGRKLSFRKTVSVAAGVSFDPPRVLFEEVDLAPLPPAPEATGKGAEK